MFISHALQCQGPSSLKSRSAAVPRHSSSIFSLASIAWNKQHDTKIVPCQEFTHVSLQAMTRQYAEKLIQALTRQSQSENFEPRWSPGLTLLPIFIPIPTLSWSLSLLQMRAERASSLTLRCWAIHMWMQYLNIRIKWNIKDVEASERILSKQCLEGAISTICHPVTHQRKNSHPRNSILTFMSCSMRALILAKCPIDIGSMFLAAHIAIHTDLFWERNSPTNLKPTWCDGNLYSYETKLKYLLLAFFCGLEEFS